jgi:hypothetical protein
MSLAYRTVLINLFFKPKKAFSTIYAYRLYRYTWPLFVLMGISGRLNGDLFKLADSRNIFLFHFISDLVVGALMGWIGMWIFSMLISFMGKWLLDGRTDSDELFDLVSYTAVASVITLLATVVCFCLLRYAGYNGNHYLHNWGDFFHRVERVHYYIGRAANLYSFVLLVIGVSVAQGVSIARGLLYVVFPVFIILAAFLLAIKVGPLMA